VVSGPDGQPNGLVVLAGPNGCRKTTVLEAALIGAGGSKLITGKRGLPAIRHGANDYEIKAEFRDATGNWKTKDVPGIKNPHPPMRPVPHWYFSSWRVPELIGPVDATVGQRGRRPDKTDQNRLLNVKQRLVNLATIDRFQTSIPGLGRYEGVTKLINDAWRDYYPEGGHAFAVVVVAPRAEDLAGTFDVFFRSNGGIRLEVNLLSAGQLELLLFLSELALNDDREGIIFIDEPELHLDPQWHRLILRPLRQLQPRAQLIVATHSPEIYDAAMSYERHFLVADDDPRARA
jgi:AAA domain, putative AbiEii toxin, Type IV TA system